MKARIIGMGNSQGVRIAKLPLKRSKLAEEVELQADDNQITIRSARRPRLGWGKKFQMMAARGDDWLLDKDPLLTATGRSLPKR